MKRIIIAIAAIVVFACCLSAGNKSINRPCGWCTCSSLYGGHYDLRGGEKGKTVTLTGKSGDSRAELEQAINQYDIIVLDGSDGPFVISSTITFTDIRHKTIVGINGAEVRTLFETSDEICALISAKVPEDLSSTSGGGILSNGIKLSEENAYRTRQALIDYTGDQKESYRNSGIFKFWSGCEDIIIRNIAFAGPGAIDIDGNHLLEFAFGANHVWIDHCSFTDAQRTSLYFGCKTDFASVTWCTFDYTGRSKDHLLATLVGGWDDPEKYGVDNLNVTFAWCSWGKAVTGRTPMVRYGNVHCLNCYYDCGGSTIDPRTDSEVRVENCYFDRGVMTISPRDPKRLPARAYEYTGNYSASSEPFTSSGKVSMPYEIRMMDARKVKRAVLKAAGPTLRNPLDISPTPGGELLFNGITLPEAWPPRYPFAGKPAKMPLPYIEHRPDVAVINVGRQLFVDDFLIDSTDMVRVNHHARMYEGNPIIVADRPTDFRNGNVPMADPFSGGVWYDEAEGLFKIWYRSGDGNNPVTGRRYLYTGYAVSEDGKNWTKPELDVIPGTNVTDTLDHDSRSMWLDKTETDPSKRYKSVFVRTADEGGTKYDLHYSADGIHWGPTVSLSGRMQDRSTVCWNPFRKQWIASLRVCAPMTPTIRARAYIEDTDLENLVRRVHWFQDVIGYGAYIMESGYVTKDPDMVYWFDIEPDEKRHPFPEIAERYLPAIYNFDATAYESVMVGEYSSWKGPENGECAQLGIQKLTEFCLGYSRDGFHYFRPDKEPVMESRQEEGAWNWGNMQPAIGNPCIVGDSLYLYCGGHKRNDINWDCWTSTGLGILRRDGFVSMHTDATGTLLTPPVTFDGRHFFVNAEAQSVSVEILSAEGKVLKGFSFDDCKALRDANGTKLQIKWKRSLSKLAGRSVRFRFRVERGDIYSFWISPWKTGESRGFTGGGGPGLHPSGIDLPLDLPEKEVRRFIDSFKPYERPMPESKLGLSFYCNEPMLQNVYWLLEEAANDSTRAESCRQRYLNLEHVKLLDTYSPEIKASLMTPEGWTPEAVRKTLGWMFSYFAGITTENGTVAPGQEFKEITVNPSFPEGLEFVITNFDTASGHLLVSWETGGTVPRLRILAPEGISVRTSYTAPDGEFISFEGDGLNHDFPSLMLNR